MDYTEYTTLQKTIDHHMKRYYDQDDPEISDFEYDMLMQKLKAAEKEHPEWITPDSPSQRVGGTYKRTAGKKVVHNVPMLSIEDVFSLDDVSSWIDKVHAIHPDALMCVEAKIDGLSMTVRYAKSDDGTLRLTLAETRGDGSTGEDVTANAVFVDGVLQTINNMDADSLELRGEVYMPREAFYKYNDEQRDNGGKLAANPRNLAAGTLRGLDSSVVKSRGLAFKVFNVQSGPKSLTESHFGGLEKLSSFGCPTVTGFLCKNTQEVLNAIKKIDEMRQQFDHDIDGAVIKLDNTGYRNDFPAGSKYQSGHIAYKYPPEVRTVVMDEIIVDIGRTGKLTYTGVFHDKETGGPAILCGTSVQRATLHNQDYIDELSIGIGGSYSLYKSGEIIPRISACIEKPKEVFRSPLTCPKCGSLLVKDEGTADIRCENPNCPAQLSRTIAYYCSISAMNIMGMGDVIVNSLIENGYIKDISDIYTLKDKEDELISSGIIGREKNISKLLASIESSKNAGPSSVLTGLSIRNVGKNTAKLLMNEFHSIDALAAASREVLTSVPEIGETTADCIISYFKNEANTKIIEKLRSYGVVMSEEARTSSGDALIGLTFVITGSFDGIGRNELTALIEANGGKVTGSVSKKTDYLIAGEAAGSKLDKAKTLNIPVLSLEGLETTFSGFDKTLNR
ncbi:MAG: NAD-dependent DNA ligase LigA [Lachnospiraceae bacterium]|nr:NAD-dependent DNA ligase LigA [Lachnospiraceae bacterium]